MRATYTKSGDNFFPVIVYDDGRRETIWGDPLVNRKTAVKFADLEIRDRRPKK